MVVSILVCAIHMTNKMLSVAHATFQPLHEVGIPHEVLPTSRRCTIKSNGLDFSKYLKKLLSELDTH